MTAKKQAAGQRRTAKAQPQRTRTTTRSRTVRKPVTKSRGSNEPTSRLTATEMGQILDANRVWAHYFPAKRSFGQRARAVHTEAQRIWDHFNVADAIIFTVVGTVLLLTTGII